MHWRQASDVAATVEVLPAKNLPLHGGPVINWFQSLAEKKDVLQINVIQSETRIPEGSERVSTLKKHGFKFNFVQLGNF